MSDPAVPISEPGLKGEITVLELERHERTHARRSAESRATVPTIEFSNIVNVGALLQREAEVGCGITAGVVAAAAHALRAVPRVNGSYRDGKYELYSRVNVGVTLIGDGRVCHAHDLRRRRKVASRVGAELAGSSPAPARPSCIRQSSPARPSRWSSSSEYDIVALTPLILPPQAGALAFGPIRDVPVVRDGQVVPGQTMQLSLAVDHRIVYGHHAAAFLGEVKAFLEEARI